jgi:Carboxypeptidase regulatory-like domain
MHRRSSLNSTQQAIVENSGHRKTTSPDLAMRLAIVMLVVVSISFPSRLFAQAANGTVTGRVTDSTGAILTRTDVTLTRTDTGLALHTLTNSDGVYSFSSLQTGPYVVQISREGFKAAKATITLTVDQTAQIDLTLLVGNQSESVTIEADTAAQLETQDSNLDYTVGAHQVADLPLNGRNPYGLAALAPGITPGNSFGAGLSTARGAVVAAATNNFQSNGGIGGSNEILLDGVSIIVCCQGQPPLTPSVEVVDQFKVLTSSPPAQFGRSSGGILNIVTKTGANGLHGDLYEYFRNDQLDAANFFTKQTGIYPIPTRHDFRLPHRFNQFGGFVSGPVTLPKIYSGKNRTFFTFGYEGTRNATSSFTTTTVPTALMRQGIFTEAPTLIYDPNNIATVGNSSVRQPLAPACSGSTCYPAGRFVANIDPVAAKLLQFLPTPNAPGFNNNYSYASSTNDTENQFNLRVDHNFSSAQRTFVRGTRDVDNHHQNGLFNDPNGPNASNQALVAYLFGVGHTWTVSPTFLLQFNYGFGYQQNHQTPQEFTNFNAGDYGFSSGFLSQQQVPGLPVISFSGLQQIGASGVNFNSFVHYTHSLGVSATLQLGNHSITAGYDGRYILENEQSLGNPLGSFSFDTTLTNGPNPSAAVPTGQSPFDSFAAFLIGTPTSTSLTRQTTIAFTQPYNAVFLQDDWRIRPKLTLNLGVRYDIETGFRERYNRWADFNPTVANPLANITGLSITGGAQYLGSAGNPGRTWQSSYKDAAPRVGFSYAPNSSTVIRGGFGILYLPTSERVFGSSTLGFSQTTTVTNTLNSTPTNAFAAPFPSGIQLPAGPAAGVQAGTGTSAGALLYNTPVSYQEQWNVGIEQQLQSNLIFNLNYAGGHGVKLPINGHPNDLNPQYFGTPGDLNQVAYLQANVSNPFYGSVTTGSLAARTVQRVQLLSAFPQYISNTALSNSSLTYDFQGIGSDSFNALQAGLSYRKTNGLTAALFYTWSKLLGNVSDLTNGFLNNTGNPGIQNYYLIKQYERSNLATDVPHRIVGNFIYSLPFGRGHRYASNVPRWADELIGGWQLNGIGYVQSGYPLGLTQTGGQAFSGSRPSYVPNINPLTTGSTHQRLGGVGQSQSYFNPAAFRLSQAFELGNVPRSASLLRSPLSFQDDLSAIKNFTIKDSLSLQFRLEAFNVFNHVQFGFPNTTVGSSTFGYITSQANLPRNVQAALKLYF